MSASSSSSTSGAASAGTSTFYHASSVSSTSSAPVAAVLEPPAAFATVAPGIYRCSSSSLTTGLPPAPKEWAPPPTSFSNGRGNGNDFNGSSESSSSGHGTGAYHSAEANEVRSIYSSTGPAASPTMAALPPSSSAFLPLETFLMTLKLKTILLLAPERRPPALAAWCHARQIRLVHLGLGALADEGAINASCDSHHLNRSSGMDLYGNNTTSSIMSLERIVKDSLEILLDANSLPCLVCDATGVSEAGVVVGCLRRMQRRNFASIRLEYRTFAASRSRSSHERFIETFDTDLVSLPRLERLPDWFAQQLADDDEEEEEALMAAASMSASS